MRGRALRDHAWRIETLADAARQRTLAERDLLAHLERAADERDALAKQFERLHLNALAQESRAHAAEHGRLAI